MIRRSSGDDTDEGVGKNPVGDVRGPRQPFARLRFDTHRAPCPLAVTIFGSRGYSGTLLNFSWLLVQLRVRASHPWSGRERTGPSHEVKGKPRSFGRVFPFGRATARPPNIRHACAARCRHLHRPSVQLAASQQPGIGGDRGAARLEQTTAEIELQRTCPLHPSGSPSPPSRSPQAPDFLTHNRCRWAQHRRFIRRMQVKVKRKDA
jgi:hypothetical protein